MRFKGTSILLIWGVLTIWIGYLASSSETRKPNISVKIQTRTKKPVVPTFDINSHLQDLHINPEKGITANRVKADQNKYSVIFERIFDVTLSKSKYHMISYISFQPYIQTMFAVENYINILTEHLVTQRTKMENTSPIESPGNPEKVYKNRIIRITYNETLQDLNNLALTFEKLQSLFRKSIAVLNKGQIAIPSNAGKRKRKGRRNKRSVASTIYNWLFGGGSDDQATKQLKENVKKLFENDQILSQQFNESLALINMNRDEIRVNRQLIQGLRRVAAEILVGMQGLEAELISLAAQLNSVFTIFSYKSRINTVRTAIFNLYIDVIIFKNHLNSLAIAQLTPSLIDPTDLFKLMKQVERDISVRPKLRLPLAINATNTFKYYRILSVYASVIEDHLVYIITCPLVDRERVFITYRIFNLPLPVPSTKMQIKHKLEHKYIAITQNNQYVTFPKEDEMMKCTITAGAQCSLSAPLFPTATVKLCEYALFIKNKELVEELCKISTSPFTTDNALALDKHYWLVLTIKQITLHIACLTKSYYIRPKSPITIIYLPEGCDASGETLYLPGSSTISQQIQPSSLGIDRFSSILTYKNVSDFALIDKIQTILNISVASDTILDHSQLIPEVSDLPIHKLPELLKINNDYPYVLPRYLLVIISGATTLFIASLIIVCVLIRNKGLLAKVCESKRPTSNCRTVPSKREVSAPAINSEELIPLRRINTRRGSIPETLPPPPPLTPVATLKQITAAPTGLPPKDARASTTSSSGSFTDSLPESASGTQYYSGDPRRSPVTPITSDNIARALHDLTAYDLRKYFKKQHELQQRSERKTGRSKHST